MKKFIFYNTILALMTLSTFNLTLSMIQLVTKYMCPDGSMYDTQKEARKVCGNKVVAVVTYK